jgi:hypothetical protein
MLATDDAVHLVDRRGAPSVAAAKRAVTAR